MKNINKIFDKNTIYNYSLGEISLKKNIVEGNLEAKLVVFYMLENEVMTEEQKSFLMKMLGAVKHNLENTLIISSCANITFKQLLKLGKVEKIMFFGSTRQSVGLNLNLKRYKIFDIQKIKCLFVDNLTLVQEDQKRKSALWSLMKVLFNV